MTLPLRPVVGVLHPGVMGAALGSALKAKAGAVVWAAAGRSVATSKRAEIADLVGVPDVAAVARRAHVIVSICPPDAALAVAEQVAAGVGDRPHPPLYVDANTVEPAVVAEIVALFGAGNVVDGRVDGPPAWERGSTELLLAGARAAEVAGLFAGSPFAARVVGAEPGEASVR